MRIRRILQFSLLSALVLLPLPSAQAHAQLVGSNPVAGAHLDALPTQVEVTFDANLLNIGSAQTNVLVVKDSQGRQIDAKNSHVSGATLSVGVSPVVVTGDFTVSWRVVSGDGHPEEGSYQFTVNKGTASAVPAPSTSMAPATSTPVQHRTKSDFWTSYGTRLLLLLAAALGVGIWFRFERARRKLK